MFRQSLSRTFNISWNAEFSFLFFSDFCKYGLRLTFSWTFYFILKGLAFQIPNSRMRSFNLFWPGNPGSRWWVITWRTCSVNGYLFWLELKSAGHVAFEEQEIVITLIYLKDFINNKLVVGSKEQNLSAKRWWKIISVVVVFVVAVVVL